MDVKMFWVFPLLFSCHVIWLVISVIYLDSLLLLVLGHSLISAIAYSLKEGHDESDDSGERSSGEW